MSRSPLVTRKNRKKRILKITPSKQPVRMKTIQRKMMALLASLTLLLIRLLIRESKEGDVVAVEATGEATNAEVITKLGEVIGVITAIMIKTDLVLGTEAIIVVIAIIRMGTTTVHLIKVMVGGTVDVEAIKIETTKLSAPIATIKIIKATVDVAAIKIETAKLSAPIATLKIIKATVDVEAIKIGTAKLSVPMATNKIIKATVDEAAIKIETVKLSAPIATLKIIRATGSPSATTMISHVVISSGAIMTGVK